MNGLAAGPEFISVAFGFDLLQCAPLGCELHHLEFKQVDVLAKTHAHVDAANAGGVFQANVQAEGGKVAVENAGVIAFKACQLVFAVPVVGNAGVKGVEQVFEAGEVLGLQQLVEFADVAPGHAEVVGQALQQAAVECGAHLQVGVLEGDVHLPGAFSDMVNGEVAGLKHQRFNRDGVHVKGRQQGFAGHHVTQIRGELLALLQQFDQKGGRAGLKPIGLDAPLVKQLQQPKRVVDRLAQPVVAVVPVADLRPVKAGQLRGKHRINIGIGVAADGAVAHIQRDVLEVVQAREQADFAELGDAGQKDELEVFVRVFEHRVEVFERVAHLARSVFVFNAVKDGFVVFIYQYHHTLTCLLRGVGQQVFEAAAHVWKPGGVAKAVFQGGELLVQALPQISLGCQHATAKADADHRVSGTPVPRGIRNQAGKQLLIAFKEFFEGVEKQALAKAPRE